AAGGPRAASIDAVETLGEPRQVFRCDPDPAISDREFTAVPGDPPLERDAPTLGCVAHGVADQIAECACQLFAASKQRRRIADGQCDFVAPPGKRFGVGGYRQQQGHDRELALVYRTLLAFERGES